MLVSIALLGFGNVGKEVYKKLRELPGFMEDFRIHVIQVSDLKNYPVAIDNNYWNYLNDSSFGTNKQVTIGDDSEWLFNSDGHDTVIDCTSYNENSKQLVLKLLSKGYWLLTCNKNLIRSHINELLDTAELANTSIFLDAITGNNSVEAVAEKIVREIEETVILRRIRLVDRT